MNKSCEKCICYENMIYASDLSDHYCHQGSFWIEENKLEHYAQECECYEEVE